MNKELAEKLLKELKSSKEQSKLARGLGYKSVRAYREFLEGHLTVAEKKVKKTVIKEELTDLVIAFDTTGSMGSYIGAVKNHVKDLIPKMFKQNPNLKVSVVAFGDYCDKQTASEFGNAYQVIDLTDNANELIDFVAKAKDTAGGDADEFYELVIRKINNETSWRAGSNKSVLFIGDCNPHPVGYVHSKVNEKNNKNTIDWRVEAKFAAKFGIKYDTLAITSVKWYKELSQITGGLNLPFSNSKETADLLEATSLARGGSATADAFYTTSASAKVSASGDLTAVYGMYKTIVNK